MILNKSPGFILTQFGFTKDNAKDKIRATDAQTLVIETDKAVAPTFFYYCLTAVVGSVVDMKVVAAHEKNGDFGNDWLKTNSAASGPFRLRPGGRTRATRSTPTSRTGAGAQPKRVVVRHIKEAASQRLLLEKGDVDYARNLTKDQLDALAGNANIKVDQGLKGAIFYISLNQKNPILAKPEVREALKWLTDYDAIQKNIVSATHTVHQSFLPIGFLGAIEDRPTSSTWPRARSCWPRPGYPNGFSVTMDVRTTYPAQDIAQAVQANWAQAGIKVDLIPATGARRSTKYRARTHDIYIGQWGPDYQDPHTNAETFAMNADNSDDAKSKTLAWRNAWNIPEMTKADGGRGAGARCQEARADLPGAAARASEDLALHHHVPGDGSVARRARRRRVRRSGPSFDNNFYTAIPKN